MTYHFRLTLPILRNIQTIERIRERVNLTILPPAVAEMLRLQAHIRSTHYSTRIEGNRLTLKETEMVVQAGQGFPGRERDVREVERYYQALQVMERWAEDGRAITEERIRKLHAILYRGRSARPTPYRDGQNVIRDSRGRIVYMPPEARDVPQLMAELLRWIHTAPQEYPVPLVAGVAHYQFETIHPFYDGNGRTGRLFTTWILYRFGYDLGKFYALEEFYAADLSAYYAALVTHPHHNYYFGRNAADMTPWLEYFLEGMAVVFRRVDERIHDELRQKMDPETLALLRPLDYRARRVLGLFAAHEYLRTTDIAHLLGISPRHTRDLLAAWVQQGWLEIADPSRRGRKYRLAVPYRQLLEQPPDRGQTSHDAA